MCGSYLCISLQSVIDVAYCAVCIPALKLKSMYLRGFDSKSVPLTSGRGLSLPTHVHACRYKAVIQLNGISTMGYSCAEVYHPAQKRATSPNHVRSKTQRPNKGGRVALLWSTISD